MNEIGKLFQKEIRVVNVGLFDFYSALQDQKIPVVHVDWKPPAGGNKKMQDILARLKSKG